MRTAIRWTTRVDSLIAVPTRVNLWLNALRRAASFADLHPLLEHDVHRDLRRSQPPEIPLQLRAQRGEIERSIAELAQEAAENLYQNSHPRFAHALVLLAQLNLLGGHPDPLGVMAMPDELLEPVGAAVLDQETWPAAVRLGVLDSYVRVASKQLGPGADSVKAGNQAMLICCSRSRTSELVLDL